MVSGGQRVSTRVEDVRVRANHLFDVVAVWFEDGSDAFGRKVEFHGEAFEEGW
jgi:hypothetical protein